LTKAIAALSKKVGEIQQHINNIGRYFTDAIGFGIFILTFKQYITSESKANISIYSQKSGEKFFSFRKFSRF